MNWDAVGALGEVLGAIAVLLTLLYLAAQIKQNTVMARATIREQRTDSSQRIILALKDEAELMRKEELTEIEQFRYDMLLRAMFRDAEAYSYQRSEGLFGDLEWAAMEETWIEAFSNPKVLEVWGRYKSQYSKLMHQDVHKYLEIIRERST